MCMLMTILENSRIIQSQFNLFLYTNNFVEDNIVIQINKWLGLGYKSINRTLTKFLL